MLESIKMKSSQRASRANWRASVLPAAAIAGAISGTHLLADGGAGEWPDVCFTPPSTSFPFAPIPYPCCDAGLGQDPPVVGKCSPCSAGQPAWNCVFDGRGGHNESAWMVLSVESLRNGLSRCDRGLIFNGSKCVNHTRFHPDVDAFVGTDLWYRLREQHRIAQHMPLSEGLWLGTHNSFNNQADGYFQYNQQYSMTDQLRMGIRYLDIDINCSPGLDPWKEIRMVHSSHKAEWGEWEWVPGMSPFDRPLRNGLEEIRAWLDANPGEFVIISHEERTEKADQNALFEMYQRTFGSMIITPSEFEAYYGVPRENVARTFTPIDWIDGSANGQVKRLLVVMRDNDGGPDTDAGGLAFRIVDVNPSVDYPGYSDSGRNGPKSFTSSLVFGPVLESSFVSPEKFNLFSGSVQVKSFGRLEVADAENMARTGVNAIMFEPLGRANITGWSGGAPHEGGFPINVFVTEIDFEELLDVVVWSWDEGYPQSAGGQGRAALLVRDAERFRTANPGQSYPVAMQSLGGSAWGVSGASVQYWSAQNAVDSENDKLPIWRFAVPGSGLQMQRLLRVMEQEGIAACWVAYDDLDANNIWEPTVYPDFGQDFGGTLWVSTAGSDANSGDAASSPFRTIQKAVNVAPIGTTIRVAPGVYNERIVVTSDNDPATPAPAAKAIAIIGDPTGTTIIQSGSQNGSVVVVFGSNTTLSMSNLWIRNGSGPSASNASGVFAAASASVALRRCTISGNDGNGILALFGTELLVEQCTIVQNGLAGISCAPSSKPVTLIANTITDNGFSGPSSAAGGLHFAQLTPPFVDCLIIGNIIANNANANIAEVTPAQGAVDLLAFTNIITPLPAPNAFGGYVWIGPSNILNQNPQLGAFGMSGGNLPVRVPLAGSPAVDLFVNAPSYILGVADGRGFSRFVKNTCEGPEFSPGLGTADAGAAEYQLPPQSVFHVNSSGNDSWSGLNPFGGAPNGPLASLAEAVDRACSDSLTTIFISGPTQTAPVTITDKQIQILASNYGGLDAIIGTGGGPVIHVDGPEELLFEIDGVRISGGTAPSGAGLRITGATAVVSRCVIESNAATGGQFGGGLSAEAGANLIVKNSIVRRNTATVTARGGGIAISDSNVDLVNSVIYRNFAGAGAGIGMVGDASSLVVIHCTIVDNDVNAIGNGAGVSKLGQGALSIYNSIVTRNGSSTFGDIDPIASSANNIVQTSLVDGGSVYPGFGNINATPLFQSAPTGDYRLLVTSPGIDAADPAWSESQAVDFFGETRMSDNTCVPNALPEAGGPDMGAFETPAFVDANRNGVNDACEASGQIDRKPWSVSASTLGPFQVFAQPGLTNPISASMAGRSPDDQIFVIIDGFTAMEFNLPQCDPAAFVEEPVPTGLFDLGAQDGVVDIELIMTQPNGPCFDSEFTFTMDFAGTNFDDCNGNGIPDSVEGQPFAANINDPSATASIGAPDGVGVLLTPDRTVTVDLGMGRMFNKTNAVDFIVYGVAGTPIFPAQMNIEVSENGYDFFKIAAFGFVDITIPGAQEHDDPAARINAGIGSVPLQRVRYLRLTGANPVSGQFVNLDAIGIISYEVADPFGATAASTGIGINTPSRYEGVPDLVFGATLGGVTLRHPNARLINGPGADLTIYGRAGLGFGVPTGIDSISIEVSDDGQNWVSITNATTTLKRVPGDEDFPASDIMQSYDLGLAGVQSAVFVRIAGNSGASSMRLDSVAFIQTALPICPPDPCGGDLTGDGVINADDLGIMLGDFGCVGGCVADINADGVVNADDLGLLLTAFGAACP